MRAFFRFSLICLALTIGRCTLSACPACYGPPDSPLTAGMNTAILVMLGITGFVLSAIVGCFFFLWRRAKRHQALLSEHLSINEHGHLEEKNEQGVIEWNNF